MEIYETDYYQVLQVHPQAEPEIIAVAYRKLAQKYHPDVAEDKETAEVRMKQINEAFAVLSDPQKRARYDEWYSSAPDVAYDDDRDYDAGTDYWGSATADTGPTTGTPTAASGGESLTALLIIGLIVLLVIDVFVGTPVVPDVTLIGWAIYYLVRKLTRGPYRPL